MDKPHAYFAGERVWNVKRTHYYTSDIVEQSDEVSGRVEFTFFPDWATEPIQGIAPAELITVRPR